MGPSGVTYGRAMTGNGGFGRGLGRGGGTETGAADALTEESCGVNFRSRISILRLSGISPGAPVTASPKNGNFPSVGRRLSAILP
jgi:hypothetical protein